MNMIIETANIHQSRAYNDAVIKGKTASRNTA